MPLQFGYYRDRERDPRKHASQHIWSTIDDALLKSLVDRYPNNWLLISECFNSSRMTIKTDKRSPLDCKDRWKEKWAPPDLTRASRPPDALFGVESTPPPPPPTPSVTTRGTKRMASASISSTTAPNLLTTGPKSIRRTTLLQDTMRKGAKKRIESAAKMSNGQSDASTAYHYS